MTSALASGLVVLLATASAPSLPDDAPVAVQQPSAHTDRPSSDSLLRPSSPTKGLRKQAFWVGVTGGAFLLGGTALVVVGDLQKERAAKSNASAAKIQSRITSGRHNALGGVALLVAGACVVGISWVLWEWPAAESPIKLSAAVTPQAGAVALQGQLP